MNDWRISGFWGWMMRRKRNAKRRLGLERLEDRQLLAVATDLASIRGRVFDDFSGNGFDAGEEVASVALDLYRGNGNAQFEPEAGDSLLSMTQTNAEGNYEFPRLTAGQYFVLQRAQTASGRTLQRSVSPPIVISAVDVAGQLITTIDSFAVTSQSVRDETTDNVPATSTAAASEAIGGSRDLLVSRTSSLGAVEIIANSALTPDLLSIRSEDFGDGRRAVIWDGGGDDPAVVNDNGLQSADLTSSGTAVGIRVVIGADLSGGNVAIRLYTDDGSPTTASRFSAATLSIPALNDRPTSVEFIPFTQFLPGTGGGADLTRVGAIEMEVLGRPNYDALADLIGAIGPTIKTQDFGNFETANLQLTKTLTTPSPRLNQPVTFTISVANSGPGAATNIVVVDTLPAGITYQSNLVTAGTFEPLAGRWTISTLASGTNASLTLTGLLTSTEPQTNTAQIFSVDQFDPNSTPNNNVVEEDDQDSVVVDVASADLSLMKSIVGTAANVGENVTFLITLNNEGPDPATGVVVRDVLPAGLTYQSDTPTAGDYDPATGLWSVANVAVGGTSPTLTIVARVNTAGAKTNTATITAAVEPDRDSTPNAGPATEDDTASVTFSPAAIDLQLTKTLLPPRPTPSDTVTTTLTLRNVGSAAATGVRVRDLLPSGLLFQSANTLSGFYDNATGTWDLGGVEANGQATLTLLATLDPNRSDRLATIINTAEVTAADQFDIDSTPGNSVATEDDQASASIIPARADLSLTKTVLPANPNVGDDVTFTVTVRNNGPDASGAFTVSDPIPSGANYVSDTPSIGDYESSTGIWSVPNLVASQSATLRIVVRTTTPQLVSNVAQIASASLPDPNSTPGNNVATEDDQATASVSSRQIDLELSKTVDDDSPRLGQIVEFTVTVSNRGVSDATGVVIEDRLPTGLTLVTATPDRGSFNTTSRRWTVGNLAAATSASMLIRARVENSILAQNGTAINVAEVVAADQVDLDSRPANGIATEDDQANASIRVPLIDLSIEKTVDNSRPNIGDVLSFDIVIANAGPDVATGIVVRDVLPSGLTYQSNSLTAGEFNPTSGNWSIASLNNNQSEMLTIFAVVTAALATGGARTNVAELIAVDQDDSDSRPNNNLATEDDQDSAEFRVQTIDLSLRQTAEPTRPAVDSPVKFTLTVRNDGPDDATGVVVASPIASGVAFVTANPVGVFDPATGRWSVGDLPRGQAATLEIVANVTSLTAVTNAAQVIEADQFDIDSVPDSGFTDGQDDTSSVTITPASANLSLMKTVNDDTPNRGSTVTYTLTLRNAGPDPAADIVVRELVPIGLNLTGNTPQAGTTYDPVSGRWSIPALAANQSATLTLRAEVSSESAITNTAEVIASSQRDPNSTPNNNVATEDDQATVTITPQLVDLALTKAIDEPRPNLGQTINYTIVLSNDGPSEATGIRVADQLPPGLVFVSSATSGSAGPAAGGGYNSATGTWTIARLPANQTATLTLTARVQPTDPISALANGITNTAQVIAVDEPDRDSTPNNNVESEDDQRSVTLTLPRTDLSLEKSVDVRSPDRNQLIAFTITLNNEGPDPATNVVVRDLLPSGLQYTDDFATVGAFDPASSRWTISELASGSSATLQITAAVVGSGATTGGTLTNIAEVISVDQLDPNSIPGNGDVDEDDFASAQVRPRVADVEVEGSVDNEEPMIDDVITITITARNENDPEIVEATGVVVETFVPDSFTLLSAAPEKGQYDPATGRWEIGSLAPGESADLVLRARVDERGIRRMVAEVIELDQFDRDSIPGNNVPTEDDQTEVIIRAPRLLTKRLFLSR